MNKRQTTKIEQQVRKQINAFTARWADLGTRQMPRTMARRAAIQIEQQALEASVLGVFDDPGFNPDEVFGNWLLHSIQRHRALATR